MSDLWVSIENCGNGVHLVDFVDETYFFYMTFDFSHVFGEEVEEEWIHLRFELHSLLQVEHKFPLSIRVVVDGC